MNKPDNPAKFSKSVLAAVVPWLLSEMPEDGRPLRLLDQFAGVGGVHVLRDMNIETWGVELEEEWASQSPFTVRGDALAPPFRPGSFDVAFTSPSYGNRMADKHNAQDPCKHCEGEGVKDGVSCAKCKGRGLSWRNTYKHFLGRDLSPGSGVMQWGEAYRGFHLAYLTVAKDMIRDEGLLIVNMSNHIRNGEEQLVVEWYIDALVGLGLKVEGVEPVRTPRNKNGANRDLRVDCEFLLVFRKLAGR